VGFYEHNVESLGSINDGEFDFPSDYKLLKKDPTQWS